MILFQWSNQGLDKPSLTFIEDSPNGGCIVECGFCGKIFNEKGKEVCPHCKNDLVFPRCDW